MRSFYFALVGSFYLYAIPLSAQITAASVGRSRGYDSVVIQRVQAFVTLLADSIPKLVNDVSPPDSVEFMEVRAKNRFRPLIYILGGGTTRPSVENVHRLGPDASLMRLDSVGTLWTTTSDHERKLILFDQKGAELIAASLTELVREKRLQDASERFCEALNDTEVNMKKKLYAVASVDTIGRQGKFGINPRFWWQGRIYGIAAARHGLAGALSLAQGDTARSMKHFLELARGGGGNAREAALVVARMAKARVDTTTQIEAGTIAYLRTGGGDSVTVQKKGESYEQLKRLYDSYTPGHRNVAIDIMGAGAYKGDPVRASAEMFDAYLDRQWAILYDRDIQIVPRPSPSGSQRLVVLEYGTGLYCGGCVYHDRAYSALMREYGGHRVVALGFHGGVSLPLMNVFHDGWDLLNQWYPSKYTIYQGKATVIPEKQLVESNGDTLDGSGKRIDGLAGNDVPLWLEGRGMAENEYEDAARRVEERLRKKAEAVLHVKAEWNEGKIKVVVNVDSLLGEHRKLALRMVLYEDTVWIRGGSIRRLQFNVVRGVSGSAGLPMGLPIGLRCPAEYRYEFDVNKIQRELLVPFRRGSRPTINVTGKGEFDITSWRWMHPDIRDWEIDRDRLHVIAFIQDLETGEVLQGNQVKVVSGSGNHKVKVKIN